MQGFSRLERARISGMSSVDVVRSTIVVHAWLRLRTATASTIGCLLLSQAMCTMPYRMPIDYVTLSSALTDTDFPQLGQALLNLDPRSNVRNAYLRKC